MCAAIECLEHAQVVDVAIVVEIEVRYDVGVGVEDLLKLFDAVCLCEGGSHGLQVKVETYILSHGVDLYSSCTRRVRARVRDGCANGLLIDDSGLRSGLRNDDSSSRSSGSHGDGFWCGSNGNDSCYSTACQHQRQG